VVLLELARGHAGDGGEVAAEVRLVGVPEGGGDVGQRGVGGAQPLGRLLQTTSLDEPLRRQPDAPVNQPLQRPLGKPELLAHLGDPEDVAAGLDELDQPVHQLALGVDRKMRTEDVDERGDRLGVGVR
jgi:hypothetical protein